MWKAFSGTDKKGMGLILIRQCGKCSHRQKMIGADIHKANTDKLRLMLMLLCKYHNTETEEMMLIWKT